jgi:hypothetical protein
MSEQAGVDGGRARLSRDRVLRGAMAVADAGGIASLTIRSIAQELGVKPMSVYHHVANKDAIIDGIVDLVFSEIDLPVPGRSWKPQMRRRSVSAREALARHRGRSSSCSRGPTPAPRRCATTTP